MVLMLVVSMLAACGGGGGDDDDDDSSDTPRATRTRDTATADEATPTAKPATPTREIASPTPEATPTEAQPTTRTIEVHPLAVRQTATTVQGVVGTTKVTVTRKEGNDIRVGFFQSEIGGIGAMMEAADWMAVITASLLIGENPSNYEFSFDQAGLFDGPSAGALMTVAVLAALLGDEVDPAMTMTGTVNPDGSVGPVGGIPHKIEGAAAAGKTTVLVPGSQRYDYDYALGQSVDVVQVGQSLGVEVKLVSDIYEAYRLLTGSEIPTPESAGNAEMPGSAFDKLRAGATKWIGIYQQEVNDFNSLPAEIQDLRVDTIGLADYYASEAGQYLDQGQSAAAYENAFNAAVWSRIAREFAELDNLYYYGGGIDPMIARVNSSQAALTHLSAVQQRLEAETPRTASDQIAIMDAFSYVSVAYGLIYQAESSIDDLNSNPDYTEQDLLDTIYAASYFYIYADLYLTQAEDIFGIGTGFGTAAPPSLDVLTAISDTMRRGSDANITYFEATQIDPWAEENGIHPNVAKLIIQQADQAYLTAVAASYGSADLAAGMLKPEAQAAVNLGSSLTAFSQSASLIAKYESLGAQWDENGYVAGFTYEAALADMLDLADQRARMWLSAVADEDPVMSLYYYENARLLRTGDAEEQLQALNYYWKSAIISESLAIFTAGGE
jgi:hypothetical protein